MKPLEREKLLDEVLGDEELAQLRQESLRQGLSLLRRRKRRRFFFRAAVPAVAIGLLGLGVWLGRNSSPARNHLAITRPPVQAASSTGSAGRVRYLSDDELLGLFPNRAIALVGQPGRQRLVFLDGAAPRR